MTDSASEKKEKQKAGRVLSNLAWLLGTSFKLSPRFCIGYFADAAVLSVWGILDAWYIKRVFDLLDRGAPLREILLTLLFTGILSLLLYLANQVYWWMDNERQKLSVKCRLQLKMFDHAVSLDIGKYELPSFYNDFIWALNNADVKFCDVLQLLRNLIRRLTSGAAVLVILFDLDPLTAGFILFFSLLGVFFASYTNKLRYEYDMACRKANRVSAYVSRVHYLPDYAKEMRMGGAPQMMDKLYDESVAERRGLIDKYLRRIAVCGAVWNGCGAVKDNGIVLILLYKMLVEKTVLLGGFALGVTSSWRVSSALKEVTSAFTEMAKHSLYIEKLRTFLCAETAVPSGDRMPGEFESLEFKDVSFAYEDGVPVINGVSLHIEKGKKIALVGYNGAGKTTLIKLLMRFYDVTGGEILYNGVNIREYDLTAYREKIGAVFQDFKIFAATVAENTASGVCTEADRPRVTESLDEATFTERLKKMPDGIDTRLTREFDENGVNLSGGEAQKIAIARTFYKRAALTVMDEPSSALDPVAEYELNDHIRRTLADRTVIFISHRLSTTRDADEIFMLEKGRVIEHGSHDELIFANGAYAALFNLQAEKYRT